jgi:hypothetical protein
MWNFTVERQLTKDLVLSVGYVGSQSYHTSFSVDNNMAPPQVCQDAQGCLSGRLAMEWDRYGSGRLPLDAADRFQ